MCGCLASQRRACTKLAYCLAALQDMIWQGFATDVIKSIVTAMQAVSDAIFYQAQHS